MGFQLELNRSFGIYFSTCGSEQLRYCRFDGTQRLKRRVSRIRKVADEFHESVKHARNLANVTFFGSCMWYSLKLDTDLSIPRLGQTIKSPSFQRSYASHLPPTRHLNPYGRLNFLLEA